MRVKLLFSKCYLPKSRKSFPHLVTFIRRKAKFINLQLILAKGLTLGIEIAAYAGDS